jgi:L-ribulokinase
MHAAVAAGAYPDIRAAAAAMGSVNSGVYRPIPENAVVYDQLFMEYADLHDHFGRGDNDVMHKLRALRRAAVASR